MKKWPWKKIVLSIACFLILLGVAPLAYLYWWGRIHNLEPLSMPLPLVHGVYVSPFFTTDLDDVYQVDVFFLPFKRTALDLDWKIVDDTGTIIQSGDYKDHPGGNTASLGHYRPKRGLRQRVIVNVHQDVQAQHLQAADSDTRLHVGLPERGLERAYGFAAAMVWAACVSGAGVLMMLLSLILPVIRVR